MLIIPKNLSDDEARECVRLCDADFDRRLDRLAADIAGSGRSAGQAVKLIALSGPSCSGKTTAARKLSEDLATYGRRVHTVSIDDFYLDRAVLTERAEQRGAKLDLDSPDTIDIDALAVTVREIFDDNEPVVELPVFNFGTGKREERVRCPSTKAMYSYLKEYRRFIPMFRRCWRNIRGRRYSSARLRG